MTFCPSMVGLSFIAPSPLLHLSVSRRLRSSPRRPARTTIAASAHFDAGKSALREGILSIAIGKMGEKPLPSSLIPTIRTELDLALSVDANSDLLLLRASFLGALFMKCSLSPEEHALLYSALLHVPSSSGRVRRPDDPDAGAPAVSSSQVVDAVALPQDGELPSYARRILDGDNLSQHDSVALGDLLYADVEMTPIKALIAHAMRVRHETAEELAGLAISVSQATKRLPRDNGPPFILLAEPFDGVLTWDLLTPLVSRHLVQRLGARVVMAAGQSSGPKYGPNLLALASELGIPAYDYVDGHWDLGAVAAQTDVHPGLERWVSMRRTIVKRPALATVEKYADVSPDRAKLFIASAFHPGYVEKMAVAAEGVGFPAYIVIGKGMEGSIGLGVGRRVANILVGWETEDGYEREWMKFSSGTQFSDEELPEKHKAGLDAMVAKTQRYVEAGSSGDAVFDARVKASTGAIDDALDVIERNAPHVLEAFQPVARSGVSAST